MTNLPVLYNTLAQFNIAYPMLIILCAASALEKARVHSILAYLHQYVHYQRRIILTGPFLLK